MSTITFISITPRINVRSAPLIGDNIVGAIFEGDTVIVDADSRELTDDGWVWWKIIADTEQWLAEINIKSDEKLLDFVESTSQQDDNDTSDQNRIPTPPESTESEAYIVHATVVNIRSLPDVQGSVIRKAFRGDNIDLEVGTKEIGSLGWVWRKVANTANEWIAEHNQISGERIMQPLATEVNGRVLIDGSRFLLDGQPMRFIGANLREFVFYGHGLDPIKHTQPNDRILQLQAMRDMDMKVARIHTFHKEVSIEECINATRASLDLLHEFDLLGILVLNDGLGHSAFYVNGDHPFHEHGHPLGHLDKSYFTGDYKQNFLPAVRAITSALRNHPAIFSWELGNEFAIHPQPATMNDSVAFLNFSQEVSQVIRTNDPNHLISTGLVNTGHVAPAGFNLRKYSKSLYSLPTIDFGTVHFYQNHRDGSAAFAIEEERSLVDLDVLKELGKPIVVEEFSATTGDKVNFTNMKLEQWFGQGAGGFMQWGLSATGRDIGVGDNLRGMDDYAARNAGHYQGLFDLYRRWANEL